MKRLTIIFILSFCAVTHLGAQVPRTISYQGVLTDPAGNFIPDGNHVLVMKLYDSFSATTPVHTETQSVPVVKGLFNAIIGTIAPIPASLAFDRAYFLGISVDGGSELTPRTPLSAVPYALRAAVADVANAVAPGAPGVVASINGQSGVITLQGGGGTTVTNTGSTFTVSSSGGGGTGIQGVQSTDGSLTITNPNGPTANLSIADNSIKSQKIQDGSITAADIAPGVIPSTAGFIATGSAAGGDLIGTYPNPMVADGAITNTKIGDYAVTPGKLSAAGSSAGQVLTSNGINVSWQPPSGGLTLPFTGSVAAAGIDLFSITNSATTGTGTVLSGVTSSTSTNATAIRGEVSSTAPGNMSRAIHGRNNGTGASGIGVWGEHNGGGYGVYGTAPNGYAVYGHAAGTGTGVRGTSTNGLAAEFRIDNPAGAQPVVRIAHAGVGEGLAATSGGTAIVGSSSSTSADASAVKGILSTTSAGINAAAVYGLSMSTTPNGIGVRGVSEGLGYGVLGTSQGGTGVYGKSEGGFAVIGVSTSAVGVGAYSESATYPALRAACNSATGLALLATNMMGSGQAALQIDNGFIKVSGTTRSAFIHTATAGNSVGNRTKLSYAGMSPGDFVMVTHVWEGNYLKGGYGVYWTGAEWAVYNEDNTVPMPAGEKFNIIVIKQ